MNAYCPVNGALFCADAAACLHGHACMGLRNPENLPMPLPVCPTHGVPMELRKPGTYEQVYTGPHYKCPECWTSIRFPSCESTKLAEREWKKRKGRRRD